MNDSAFQSVLKFGDCFDYVRVFSNGFWNETPGESILKHSLVRFQVLLILIFSLTNFFHFFLRRLHMQRFVSEFLAGLILGATVLQRVFPQEYNILLPPLPNQVLASLAKLGYIMFTFIAGVRMDPRLIRVVGKKAIVLGALVCLFPLTMIMSMGFMFHVGAEGLSPSFKAFRTTFPRIYFSAITTTQFVGVTNLLLHLKITNSRLGHLALASTLVSELMRFTYSTVLGFGNAYSIASLRAAVESFILANIFLFVIVVVLRKLMYWFIRMTPEGKPIKEMYTTFVIAALLVSASMGDSVGLHYLFGPFLLGLVVPAGSPLALSLISKYETIVAGLLIPLLTTFCASKFNLWDFLRSHHLNFWISLYGYMVKLVATFIITLCCKISPKDAAALTLILNIKGVLEIGIFLSFGNIDSMDMETTSGLFLVFLLSAFVPTLVKLLYDPRMQYIGYKKKSIQHSSHDAELQILACAHRAEDATAAVKLLELFNPTKQSPLSVFGLCLEELVGSATPLLINHQLNQKTLTDIGSRSQPIIDIFNYLQRRYNKLVQVNVFTAVSPLKQMHEDICFLAFEKAVSFIIVPFHKKWNSKGKMVSSSSDLRALNQNVLERAPCSVGILIERRRSRCLSSMFAAGSTNRVALLFVGGPNDREALALALRMAGSSQVQLTVVRFITPQVHVQDQWENMLDSEGLRIVKHEISQGSGRIDYIEETVRDGSDTAAVVQSMDGSYDLILVGCRHEPEPQALSGLSEWTESPELGPLGDMLASEDLNNGAASVLVVQQQILKASHSSILN